MKPLNLKKKFSMKPQRKNSKVMEDRLSNLPEPILHHILSFLDMADATQTRLLSKKWRYIYTTLPSLTFHRDYLKMLLCFTNYNYITKSRLNYSTKELNSVVNMKFVNFVNQVLVNCEAESIQTFRLYWGSGLCDSSFIESWLGSVVAKNVQEIDVQISTEKTIFELPEGLWSSKFLRSLKLHPGSKYPEQTIIIPTPESVDLPVLRNLSFTKVDYVRDELLDVYFTGCPNLERVELIECNLDNDQKLTFSAPQLKHLVIEILDRVSWNKKCKKNIVISAPNLVSFTCKDYVTYNYSLEKLGSLEVANIQMRTADRDYNDEDFDWDAPEFTVEDSKRMMKLLKGLYNVKYLTLNPTFLEVISEAPDVLERSYTPLGNLRYLKLITQIGKACLRSIVYLLENSPNVETLILEINSVSDLSVCIAEYWGEEMVLVEQLKEIQIWNSERCVDYNEPERLKEYLKYEVILLKMFLKYGVKLKKMKIFYSAKWSRGEEDDDDDEEEEEDDDDDEEEEEEEEEEEGDGDDEEDEEEERAFPCVSSEMEGEEIMKCFEEEILECPRASSDVTILFRERQETDDDEDWW
ncbi:hypothetical protein ACHQM5_002353 [Ranunculus cassubicifolius]